MVTGSERSNCSEFQPWIFPPAHTRSRPPPHTHSQALHTDQALGAIRLDWQVRAVFHHRRCRFLVLLKVHRSCLQIILSLFFLHRRVPPKNENRDPPVQIEQHFWKLGRVHGIGGCRQSADQKGSNPPIVVQIEHHHNKEFSNVLSTTWRPLSGTITIQFVASNHAHSTHHDFLLNLFFYS